MTRLVLLCAQPARDDCTTFVEPDAEGVFDFAIFSFGALAY